MTCKEAIQMEMLKLAKNPKVRFVGYNTKYGPKMSGTLEGCEDSCIETPVAENLMCGVAMGLALEGFLPVLCIERMDFVLTCADALINHLSALGRYGLSFPEPVIVRICIGNDTPLDPGEQHKQDYTSLLSRHFESGVTGNVFVLAAHDIHWVYSLATEVSRPIIIVEHRSLYDKEYTAPPL